MALKKKIKHKNGVELSYHRVAMIKIDTNQQISVLVESYIDEEGRQYEKDYAAGLIEGEPVWPYTDAEYINFDYDENHEMFQGNVIKNIYKWLKKQEKFQGSEDAQGEEAAE